MEKETRHIEVILDGDGFRKPELFINLTGERLQIFLKQIESNKIKKIQLKVKTCKYKGNSQRIKKSLSMLSKIMVVGYYVVKLVRLIFPA